MTEDVLQLRHSETVPAHSARKRRPWGLLVVLQVALVVAACWALTRSPVATGKLAYSAGPGGKPTITMTSGSFTFDQLKTRLAKDGHSAYITQPNQGSDELMSMLVINPGAHLSITNKVLLLHSDTDITVRITDHGTLTLERDTVTSWTNNDSVDNKFHSGGRADIVANGAKAVMTFDNSAVSFLGATNDHSGVGWLNGAEGGATNTTFEHDWRGAYVYRSGRMVFTGDTFDSSQEAGLLMLSPAPKSHVDASIFTSNAQGLDVSGASQLTLTGLTASNNKEVGVRVFAGSELRMTQALISNNGVLAGAGGGLSLTDSLQAKVTESRIWGNWVGIQARGGDVTISDTLLSGEITDGALATGAAHMTLIKDRFDHNPLAGVYGDNSSVIIVTNSLFDGNDSGLFVNTTSVTATATGNTFRSSGKDAVSLTGVTRARISGNVITNSRHGAISLSAKADITKMIAANTITKGQIVSRVRAP